MKDNNQGFYILIGSIIIAMGLIFSMSSNMGSYIINDKVNTIDQSLTKIYDGRAYFIRNYTVMGATGNTTISIHTGNNVVHFLYQIKNNQRTSYLICENSTLSSNGTRLEPRNRNRNYTDNTSVQVYMDSILLDCGTGLGESELGTKRKLGGMVRNSQEKILKPNTTYTININSEENGDNIINYYLEWYEN